MARRSTHLQLRILREILAEEQRTKKDSKTLDSRSVDEYHTVSYSTNDERKRNDNEPNQTERRLC